MAGISERNGADGTTYQVRWRTVGGRTGKQQYESFSSMTEAEKFRLMVAEAGEHLPPGWVPGVAFAPKASAFAGRRPPAHGRADDRALRQSAHRHRSGLPLALPAVGQEVGRDAGLRHRQRRHRRGRAALGIAFLHTPKTTANYHGLLAAACKWALGKALITHNPCEGSRLPRQDIGTDDGDDVHWLTVEQFKILLAAMTADVRALVEVAAKLNRADRQAAKHRIRQEEP